MKGILFTEPLFHRVVSGEKTQTRRTIKPQPDFISENFHWAKKNNGDVILPRYGVGEKLYLKEPYFIDSPVIYKYDSYKDDHLICEWQNKLFMPEKYARYFIEITGVRCERLQDISDEDCFREGIVETQCISEGNFNPVYENGLNLTDRKGCTLIKQYDTPQEAYAALIDSISGRDTWKSNPYVWVYDFKLTKK
ncbi:MAG: hypothetical protein LBK58_13095 [Prevotellaceae bacterium]|jgi:hypothetical protein|nr:hypothetical protein [Prevotellaceae bacterium]